MTSTKPALNYLCNKAFLFALIIIVLLCSSFGARAQSEPLSTYQGLSHLYYAKQKDSLRKAWVCPTISKNKATQKKYREFWDSRTEFLTGAIADDDYLYDKEITGYVQGIIDQIVQANKRYFPANPLLLIDRSSSVNAYAIGSNVIAVNLGLIAFSATREELALVIAHELSHNILGHAENAMKEKAEWLSSDEYAKSLNAVLDSKYERLTQLRKVLEGFSFSRSRHQRYHESEADSMAVVLLKESKIPFDAKVFLRLDSSDNEYRQPLKHPLKEYFTSYGLPFEEAWITKRSRGLSTKAYNFADTSTITDSLKTHPDCVERFNKLKELSTQDAKFTIVPASIRERTNAQIIWNLYVNSSITPCLYRILLEKDKGYNDPWYDFMVNNIFSALFYADKKLKRFSAIGVVRKELISSDCYALQTMLEQMPRESLDKYCTQFQQAAFWGKTTASQQAFNGFMQGLVANPDETGYAAAKAFNEANASSMYCELADQFKKK